MQPNVDESGTPPPPVACSLSATEYVDRAARWRAVLAGTARTRLPGDGVRVRFGSAGVVLDAHAPAEAAPLLDELLGPDDTTPAC